MCVVVLHRPCGWWAGARVLMCVHVLQAQWLSRSNLLSMLRHPTHSSVALHHPTALPGMCSHAYNMHTRALPAAPTT
jgi:hypothetical protein